jgi:alkanesulfonate monooxygenase SsuD/methylene tetrahydromethanopterin reductase-like flavin-dependent oxidoreductase (luciferase family)
MLGGATHQPAKEVASLDVVSGGRFVFGVGAGWNREEMEDHGTGGRCTAASLNCRPVTPLLRDHEPDFGIVDFDQARDLACPLPR